MSLAPYKTSLCTETSAEG
uniref:Uncharacterized protein n=1 Tax=Arundo donax TaxID=35708 RepID=A0A0A9ELA1_ARUDO